MIRIAAGSYQIGTDTKAGFPNDLEGPKIKIEIPAFAIEATTVTNAQFTKFVEATGYLTEAERFGWSFVFHYFLADEVKEQSKLLPELPNWYAVLGATWQHPEGPQSTIQQRLDHPVTQVSRNDAIAYCQWADQRLPTEAEWEVAARGGCASDLYPWGDDLMKNQRYHCNIWQGDFPKTNTLADGYAGTAPVKTFEPNGYGLYQVLGNVWEWCVNPRRVPLTDFQKMSGAEYWQKYQAIDDLEYATKGGSFLCHQSYCKRYRVAARNGNTGMSASNNLGFRCAR